MSLTPFQVKSALYAIAQENLDKTKQTETNEQDDQSVK
jgi:hypothetical protein